MVLEKIILLLSIIVLILLFAVVHQQQRIDAVEEHLAPLLPSGIESR